MIKWWSQHHRLLFLQRRPWICSKHNKMMLTKTMSSFSAAVIKRHLTTARMFSSDPTLCPFLRLLKQCIRFLLFLTGLPFTAALTKPTTLPLALVIITNARADFEGFWCVCVCVRVRAWDQGSIGEVFCQSHRLPCEQEKESK